MNFDSTSLLQPSTANFISGQGAQVGQTLPKKMAQEFEGVMLSQLLKQMRQSSGGEGLFPGDKSDTYGGMFDMMIGKFLSENGGFGLADQLTKSFDGYDLGVAAQSESISSVTNQQAQKTYQLVNTHKESSNE